jgi:hypothetical protein
MSRRDRIEAANHFFWLRSPHMAGWLSPTLGELLIDSRYLLAWPRLAAWAPASALVLGATVGLLHPGRVFSGWLPVVAILVVLGATGSTLGMWFLVTFVPVDLVRPGAWASDVSQRGLLVADLVLALLVVVIAASSWRLRDELMLHRASLQARHPSLSSVPDPVLEATAAAGIYMMLAWAWLQSVPMLIRPVATWAGDNLNLRASDVEPLQQHVLCLSLLGGLAAAVVSGLDSYSKSPRSRSVDEQKLNDLIKVPSAEGRRRALPTFVVYSLRATVGVTLAAGLFGSVWEAVTLWITLILGQIAQDRVGLSASWNDRVLRLPVAARLLIVLVGTATVGALILPWVHGEALLPILVVTLIGLALTAIALPPPSSSSR